MNPDGSRQIRLLLVDPHPIVRIGVERFLAANERIQVVKNVASIEEARLSGNVEPNVAVLDGKSLLDDIKVVKSTFPSTRVVAFTMSNNTAHVRRVVRCGATGYVVKTASPEELVRAIEAVHSGVPYFSPEISNALLEEMASRESAPPSGLSSLTQREREVLKMVASGMRSREISSRLGVALRMVTTHRERIKRKLGVHTVAGLTRFALDNGILDRD